MTKTKFWILPIILLLCNVGSFAKETWFNQRITWTYGKEGLAWETTIKQSNGRVEYLLELRPLSTGRKTKRR